LAEKTRREWLEDSFDVLLRQAVQQGLHGSHVSRRSMLTSGTKLVGGRFEVARRVGAGGLGIVYEAFDTERRAKVALKTLTRLDAGDIYRLKNEFRALADVTHQNLVGLHELFAEDGLWFFAMDLVDGVAFDAWLRPSGALDEARLRSALPQLLRAVLAIHDAGKLHRDLKPSNVLVTHQGRVVVLDFGLAADPELGGVGQTIAEDNVSGTPAYMAPEQAAGQQATAASDFYALGVMLFEVLTGELPFDGRAGEVLAAKQRDEAPRASDRQPGVPSDLDALCTELLARDPDERLAGAAVQDWLQVARMGNQESAARTGNALAGVNDIVGRDAELAALQAAYVASCEGDKPVIVLLSGESGIGKSALVERFLAELRDQGRAVVLAGRCYERESVPFKGFDALIDELSRYLRKLTAIELATAIPREVFALRRLFPVLGRIDAIAQAPERTVADAFELRRRGFLALGELLGRICDRQPLVVAIDDLQWSDRDSTTLLLHLVRQPDAPRLLFIASHRSEGMHESLVLKPLYDTLEVDIRLDVRPLRCGPLPMAAAAELVAGQLGQARQDLLREAGGNPFLLGELARAGATAQGQSLGEILRARVAQLPGAERRLLEVIAVAARPLSLEVAAEAAGAKALARTLFDALRSVQLVRSATEPGSVECYHDRIRESVVAGVAADVVRACHAALAQALLRAHDADPEHLCEHLENAQEAQLAAEYAARAADRAVRAFAFDQAARFYEKALQLGVFVARETHRLRVALADALANGGRGSVAWEAYLRACDSAPDAAEVLELKRRAVAQLLWTGRLDEGRRLLAEVLEPFDMRLPHSPVSAVVSLAIERAWLSVRGLRLREREPDLERNQQLVALHELTLGLAGSDPLSSCVLNARILRRALDAGDARRVATGLRHEIWCRSLGIGDPERVPELLEHARLLQGTSQDAPAAFLELVMACYEFYGRADGDMDAALAHITQFLAFAHAEPLAISAYVRGRAEFQRASILVFQGRLADLARELPTLLDETRQRSDLFLPPLYMSYALCAWLASGAHAEAEREHARAAHEWAALENPFAYQDVALQWGRVSLFHYRGDARGAWLSSIAQDARFGASFVSRSTMFASLMHFLRSMTAATLAAETVDAAERKMLLQQAERAPFLLRSNPLWKKWLLLPRAAAACARRDRERAIHALRQLDSGARPASFGSLHVYALRRRLGVLIGGDEGKTLVTAADSFFRAGGTRDVERLVATLLPGCQIR
jgi:eukaryotic-like serine/threonine-protein kinase